MKSSVRVFSMAVTFFVAVGVGSAKSNEAWELPFRLYRGHFILVKGTLGGTEMKLILDTGSSHTVVQKSFTRKAGLKIIPGGEGKSFGKRTRYDRVILRGLRFGEFVTTAVCYVKELPWKDVDAMIGLDILKRTNFTIDFQQEKLIFGSGAPGNSERVPFEFASSLVLIDVAQGDRSLKLSVDTGSELTSLSQDSVRASVRYLAKARGHCRTVIHVAGQSEACAVELPALKAGKSTWTDLPALILDNQRGDSGRDGVLGVLSLDLAWIHFDFDSQVLSWHGRETASPQSRQER